MRFKYRLTLGVFLLAGMGLLLFRFGISQKTGGRKKSDSSSGHQYQVFLFTPPYGSTRLFPSGTINAKGAMVGGCFHDKLPNSWRGFLYDPRLDPEQAIHLDDLIHVPKGWCVRYAYGINDHGALVAAIGKKDQDFPHGKNLEIKGIVVDTRQEKIEGKWNYFPVPNGECRISLARTIDNRGELNGVCSLDDPDSRDDMVAMFTFNTGLYRETGPDLKPVFLPIQLHWKSIHPDLKNLQMPIQMGEGLFPDHYFSFKIREAPWWAFWKRFSW